MSASDIFNMVNNTLKTGLIIAATNITIDILNASFPNNERLLRFRQQYRHGHAATGGRQHVVRSFGDKKLIVPLDFFESNFPVGFVLEEIPGDRRRLVYLPQSRQGPTWSQLARRLVQYLDSVPPVITQILDNSFCPSQTPEVTRCAIVTSTVCVFLDEGDDRQNVRRVLGEGIQASVMLGEFEAAIPEEHRIP